MRLPPALNERALRMARLTISQKHMPHEFSIEAKELIRLYRYRLSIF